MGEQLFRSEQSLGQIELGRTGIEVWLWQGRLVRGKILRKTSEENWNNVQKYFGR